MALSSCARKLLDETINRLSELFPIIFVDPVIDLFSSWQIWLEANIDQLWNILIWLIY